MLIAPPTPSAQPLPSDYLRLVCRIDKSNEIDNQASTIAHHEVQKQDSHNTCRRGGKSKVSPILDCYHSHPPPCNITGTAACWYLGCSPRNRYSLFSLVYFSACSNSGVKALFSWSISCKAFFTVSSLLAGAEVVPPDILADKLEVGAQLQIDEKITDSAHTLHFQNRNLSRPGTSRMCKVRLSNYFRCMSFLHNFL